MVNRVRTFLDRMDFASPDSLSPADASLLGTQDCCNDQYDNPFAFSTRQWSAYERAWAAESRRKSAEELEARARVLQRLAEGRPSLWQRVRESVGRLFTRVMFIVCWNFARKGK